MPPLPALKIAVLNDIHTGGPQGGGFQNTFLTADVTLLLEPTIDAINRASPDLVLIPGDLTHDATFDQLVRVDSCLRRLSAPLLVCKGNHDRETPEAAARFDDVLGKWSRPGLIAGAEPGLPGNVAILTLEASWNEDGTSYESSNPPLATIDDGLLQPALEKLNRMRPELLLVACHYPLASQAEYAAPANLRYAGHIDGGEALLRELTLRAGAVICFTGHNHFHHVLQGERWLQCATAALAEYPAEYRIVTVAGTAVSIETSTACRDMLNNQPTPVRPAVAGRPGDRDLTWRPG